MKYIFLFLIILEFTITSIVTSQIPNKISYQGLLTTTSGTPIPDGIYELKFEIFKTHEGGLPVWSETHSDVYVSRGSFNIVLGSIISLPNIFRAPLFMEITVLSGPNISSPITFSPRSEFTSSPYAMQADTANFARAAPPGGDAGGDLIGTYPDPYIANNAVTSEKILDGSILRADVASGFKAPYADTSDFAKAGIPTSVAGGDLTGTYPNPTIATNAVTSTKILDGTIGAIDIRDTTIVTPKIKDASITTSKIAANAVHGYANAYRAEYNYWSRSSNWQSIPGMSVSITTTGGPVLIMYTGGGFNSNHGQADDVQLDVAIFRGGNVIATNRTGISDYDGTTDKGTSAISLQYLDFPPAGNYTYEIKLLWDVRDEPLYQNVFTPNHGSNSLTVIELKR